ncbi:hypothetical protein VPH35_072452 [Triticum aestivum]
MLAPVRGDGIVAEEGLLPGEPRAGRRLHLRPRQPDRYAAAPSTYSLLPCTYGQACSAYLAPCGLGRSQCLLANVRVWMLLVAAAVHVCLVCPCCFVFSPPHPRQIKFLPASLPTHEQSYRGNATPTSRPQTVAVFIPECQVGAGVQRRYICDKVM